jgi:shikimate dehydrogenase
MINLGLVGWPVDHSLSPCIHQAALKALGMEGTYELFPIPPAPDCAGSLKALFDKVRRREIHGLNVTIPHKQSVIPLMDDLTETAQDAGAVNTISLSGGRLVGDNTDMPGFLRDFFRCFSDGTSSDINQGGPSICLILGAGGSARAVASGLRKAGFRLAIAARRRSQVEYLIEKISSRLPYQLGEQSRLVAGAEPEEISALELTAPAIRSWLTRIDQDREKNGHDISLYIVNTTPAGMWPRVEITPWPDQMPFPDGANVYDLVYNPAQTQFLKQAEQAGCRGVNGTGMLVEQAALSFERWTGITAPRQEMFRAAQKGII